jgi:hypothetical protein
MPASVNAGNFHGSASKERSKFFSSLPKLSSMPKKSFTALPERAKQEPASSVVLPFQGGNFPTMS